MERENRKVVVKTTQETVADPSQKTFESTEEIPNTMLYCRYTTSPVFVANWWINISKTCYLVNLFSGEKIEMISAIGVPYAPAKYHLKKFGDSINFILIFPQIPKAWATFNLIENTGADRPLSSRGLVRNDTGIYRVVVS